MLTIEDFIREREKKYCDEIPGSEYDYRTEDVVNFGLLILNPENWYAIADGKYPEIGQSVLVRYRTDLKIDGYLINDDKELAFILYHVDRWIPLT